MPHMYLFCLNLCPVLTLSPLDYSLFSKHLGITPAPSYGKAPPPSPGSCYFILVSFSLLSLSLVLLFLGFFVVFAVAAQAGRVTFPPESLVIVLVSHRLRGCERTSAFSEQPIGTHTLWNDPWLAEKCLSLFSFSKVWIQSQGEEQKSRFLSEQLN